MPTAAKVPKTRAIATPGSAVGAARYHLYRMAYGRINEAMQEGFYLEAITLIESLLADRLESRLTFVLGIDFSFKTLGQLITKSGTSETDPALKTLVKTTVDSWRALRNDALHEMAKLAVGNTLTWSDRMLALVVVASDGLSALKAVDKRCKRLKALGI
jgi:hypothetical protein